LPTVDKLAQYHLLPTADARALHAAYVFLRDVEHRLQMEENLQTHTIPTGPAAQLRLARLMGFKTAAEFEAARRSHTGQVREIFDRLLKSATPSAPALFPAEFAGAEERWKEILAEHSFRDPEKAF